MYSGSQITPDLPEKLRIYFQNYQRDKDTKFSLLYTWCVCPIVKWLTKALTLTFILSMKTRGRTHPLFSSRFLLLLLQLYISSDISLCAFNKELSCDSCLKIVSKLWMLVLNYFATWRLLSKWLFLLRKGGKNISVLPTSCSESWSSGHLSCVWQIEFGVTDEKIRW